jgi:hypothetical protein
MAKVLKTRRVEAGDDGTDSLIGLARLYYTVTQHVIAIQ